MDESAYRNKVFVGNPNLCPFEKTILTRCAACSLVEKHCIAEREIVTCSQADALRSCVAFRNALRHNFTFALGKLHIDGPLPHAQEMRLQCGGLRGLQIALDGGSEVADVAALLTQAQEQFGDIVNLPYVQIVQAAHSAYPSR